MDQNRLRLVIVNKNITISSPKSIQNDKLLTPKLEVQKNLPDILHISKWISNDLDEWFYQLYNEIPWTYAEWKPGSKLHRMVYRYNFNDEIKSIEKLSSIIETGFPEFKVRGVWCNLYRDGLDYTPYHQDIYGLNIFTVSFGVTRDCLIKSISGGSSTKYTLESGDMLYFNQKYNLLHKHSIPVRTNLKDPRISIVFFAELIK